MIKRWKVRVRQLKTETYALYLALREPRVPWYAKALIVLVVAHTFSPIDLIPDVIPVLGYLDDLVIAPLGIALAIRMIPPDVLAECRRQAQVSMERDQPPRWGAAVIVATWLLSAALLIALLRRVIAHS